MEQENSGNSNEGQLLRAHRLALVDEGITLFHLQLAYWADFGPINVPVSRDNDLVAQNFPRIPVELRAPAFIWPELVHPGFSRGEDYPCPEHTIDEFIKDITDRQTWARCYDCKFESEEGRNYRYIVLSTSDDGGDSLPIKSSKLRVWFQGGVHGNEPAGDQALFALMGKMDTDSQWAAAILEQTDILIFPCFNPDGIAMFIRPSLFAIDFNRDHIKSALEQTKYIKRIFNSFAPHVAADMHEYSARATFNGYKHANDVMFSAAKNLNIHPRVRELSETLFAENIGKRLEKAQFRWGPYAPTTGAAITFREAGSDGKIGRNAMGLTQCVSFLCETRGLGIADQHFHRRTAAALKFAQSLLEISSENHEFIRNTLESSVDDFIHGKEEIVIKDRPNKIDRTFSLIKVKTGELVQLPIQLASTTPTTATMTRRRPEAYSFPPSMPEIAQRLTDLGLEVQQARHPLTATAEVSVIVTAEIGQTYDEGVVPLTVTTNNVQKTVEIPVGSYVVSTRQKNAALAFIALEPENTDSYVSTNIIPLISGDEYPIYRILTPLQLFLFHRRVVTG